MLLELLRCNWSILFYQSIVIIIIFLFSIPSTLNAQDESSRPVWKSSSQMQPIEVIVDENLVFYY